MDPKKKITFADMKPIFKGVIVTLGLSIVQAATYLASFLWQLDLSYYLIMVFVMTIIFSIYFKDLTKSIFFIIISIFVGAIIGLGMVLMPPVILRSDTMIEFTITFYLLSISKLALFNLVISTFSSILGSLLIQ